MKSEEVVQIRQGRFVLDKRRQQAQVAASVIYFTKKEFALLWILVSDPGRVFHRDELVSKVWGRDVSVDARTVDAHVARLRRKLRGVPRDTCHIETVWGIGYKFKDLKQALDDNAPPLIREMPTKQQARQQTPRTDPE